MGRAQRPGDGGQLDQVDVLAGSAFAAAGQLILLSVDSGNPDLGRMQLIGGALLIMGAGTFGAGTARVLRAAYDADINPDETSNSDGRRRLPLERLLAPVILSVAGAVIFAVAGESPVVVGLWLGGMITLLVATLWGNRPRLVAPHIRKWWHLLLLAAVLLTYLASRIVWLSSLPLNLDGDFASVGLQARALATNGRKFSPTAGQPSQFWVSLRPKRERRRTVADDLYKKLVDDKESFWTAVYPLYMNREITKQNVRDLVRKGLEEARGNYKIVCKLFNLEPTDYKKFLNFLRKHDCQLPFKEFRQ